MADQKEIDTTKNGLPAITQGNHGRDDARPTSMFAGLNGFLVQKDRMQEQGEENFLRLVAESRQNWQPTLSLIFGVFGDYLSTIIAPRRPSFRMVVKKCEEQYHPYGTPHPKDPYYIYLANIVSENPTEWPIRNPDRNEFLIPNAITGQDWYPNVALQLQNRLLPTFDKNSRQYLPDLELETTVKVLGDVGTLGQDMKGSPFYKHTRDGGWDRIVTSFTLYPQKDQLDEFKQQLGTIFTLVTPNVLNHGIKK
jgi:hypothetical protein